MTLLLSLSAILLSLSILVLRRRGRGRWLAWLAPACIFLFTLMSGLHLGLAAITGEGLNDAVFYHLATGLQGGDVSQYLPHVLGALLAVVAVAAGLWRLRPFLRGTATQGHRAWDLATAGLALAALSVHPVAVASAAHALRFAVTPQLAQGFAEPAADLLPPENPRNLVIIYLESFERTYMDPGRFPGLTPRLGALEERAVSFTGMGQTVGADFTIGGMVASQCGTPLILSGGVNSGKTRQFLSGATCLGDLLSKAGYQLSYLGGASTEFAGKGSFYQTHGYDQVSGLKELRPELSDPDYRAEWGLQDDTLFDLARTRFDRLAGQDKPFVLTLLTLDTHHPNGHADTNRTCADRPYQDGANPMLNAVFCTDFLAGQFIEDILSGPHGADTVVAVMSDHLAMVNAATDLLEAGPRRNLLMILDGTRPPPRRIDRAATTLDTAPTLLSYLGFDLPRLGFGVDLLRGDKTLAEHLGIPVEDRMALDRHLMGYEALYDRLWAFPSIAAGAYVNLERMELHLGHDAYGLPALLAVDEDLAVSTLTIADRTSDETLTEAATALPDGTRYLWFDDCAALALGLPESDVPPDASLCVAGGERRAGFALRPVDKSGYLAADELAALWHDPMEGAVEPAALQAIGTARGDLPTRLGLQGLATGDRGVLLQLSDFGAGASFVRRQTVETLSSGEDWLLQRGISLVGLGTDGRVEVLDRLDPCDPAFDAAGHGPWKDHITAPGPFVAHLVLVHDSAFCGVALDWTTPPLVGLDLPVLRALPARKAYAAVIHPDGRTVEVSNPGFPRIRLYLTPDGPLPVLPALTLSTPSALPPSAPAPEPPAPASLATGEPPACLAPPAQAPTTARAALPLGIRIGEAALHERIGVGDGWWDPEPFGRWTGRKTATLSLILPETTAPLSLALELSTYRQTAFTLRARHSGTVLAEVELAGDQIAQIDLSGVPRGKPVDLVLELIGPDLTCPAREGHGSDTRALGLMLRGLTLTATGNAARPVPAWPGSDATPLPAPGCLLPEPTAPEIPALSTLPLGRPVTVPSALASTLLALGPGWWADEPFGRWMAAGPASIALTLPEGAPALSLTLTAAVFGGQERQATLSHDGKVLARGSIGDGRPLVADLSLLPCGQPVILTLALEGELPTCPTALGQSADTRTLGLMLHSVALSDTTAPKLSPAIAHGGGRLNGEAISNSLDALTANADRFDLIEIDLVWTTDQDLVCLHDWAASFASRFGDAARPVDLATFRDLLARTPDRPRNCDLDSLAEWLRANPGKRIVTDIKTEPVKGHALIARRHPDLVPRFVAQAYQPDEIAALRTLGFDQVIWTLYRFGDDPAAILRSARDTRPSAIAMPLESARSGLLPALARDLDLPLYVHTVNDQAEAACLMALGATGVYSDDLDTSDLAPAPAATDCAEAAPAQL